MGLTTDTIKALSMAIYMICGILTIIVMAWNFIQNKSWISLTIATLGIIGFCYFINLIMQLIKLSEKAKQ